MAYRRTARVLQRLSARREEIVGAAQALAAERGMEAVQIVPVARRAGIAAGTVYRYFPAKTDLVAALVSAQSERDLAAIRAAADAAPGPLSALAAASVTFAVRARHRRKLAWAVLAEAVDGEVDALRLAHRRALAAEFARRIAAASDHLPEQNAALGAAAMLGALLESLVGPLAAEGGDAAAEKEAVQAAALMALRALGVADARARGLVVQAAWPTDDPA
jgi:AcrR family transcriptional regulator